MTMFKVMDVRALYDAHSESTVYLNLDGLGVSDELSASVSVDPTRAALMLLVFSDGYDCYWDTDTRVFTTTLLPWPDTPSAQDRGMVASWDVRIPGQSTAGQIEFFLALLPEHGSPTSGNQSTGWAHFAASDDYAVLALSLLQSAYTFYTPTSLRNTDLTEGWPI